MASSSKKIKVDKDYKCSLCTSSFDKQWQLNAHINKVHSENTFCCDVEGCEKSFRTADELRRHKLSHINERQFICDFPECGASFNYKNVLEQHKLNHETERQFICDFPECGASFNRHDHLERHQLSHINERQFICDFPNCGASFNRHDYLQQHSLVHNESRPFECNVCGAGFKRIGGLDNHLSDSLKCGAKFTLIDSQSPLNSQDPAALRVKSDINIIRGTRFIPRKWFVYFVLCIPIEDITENFSITEYIAKIDKEKDAQGKWRELLLYIGKCNRSRASRYHSHAILSQFSSIGKKLLAKTHACFTVYTIECDSESQTARRESSLQSYLCMKRGAANQPDGLKFVPGWINSSKDPLADLSEEEEKQLINLTAFQNRGPICTTLGCESQHFLSEKVLNSLGVEDFWFRGLVHIDDSNVTRVELPKEGEEEVNDEVEELEREEQRDVENIRTLFR
ncbi:uncharacterized protein LOC110859917 [Folsomia candida]|uniref:uncharacterized protein LOC110859917 n=1 Tax=Folsomia candida TaxID=158441 RepID=UPI000B8F556B|nr:uncharacterized protein LOC110859917 [Folsomia candida]